MPTSVDLREEWAKSVYSNFSSHDCIRHEIKILNRAIEFEDNVLADFLKINIPRRKKRVAGIPIESEYHSMIAFFKKYNSSSYVSNAILSGLAARICGCAVRYIPSMPDSIKAIDLFRESKTIVDKYCTDLSQYLARETAASVKVAIINEMSYNETDFNNVLDSYDKLIELVDDYIPAYFDRASFAFKAHRHNVKEMPAEKVISLFKSTVIAAAKYDQISLPPLENIKVLEEYVTTYCIPSSALPLALRQLWIAQALFTVDPSNRAVKNILLSNFNKMENNRFDTII